MLEGETIAGTADPEWACMGTLVDGGLPPAPVWGGYAGCGGLCRPAIPPIARAICRRGVVPGDHPPEQIERCGRSNPPESASEDRNGEFTAPVPIAPFASDSMGEGCAADPNGAPSCARSRPCVRTAI